MKIVQVIGGLGNQLFQYAFAIVLQKIFPNEVIMLDVNPFKGYPLHNGYELDKIFNTKFKLAKVSEIRRVYYPFINNYSFYRFYKHLPFSHKNEFKEIVAKAYNPNVFKPGPSYYDGYWQDYRYYINYRKEIQEELVFRTALSRKNQELITKIREKNSVSIHVRRGDYNSNVKFGGLCPIDYYERAILSVKDLIGKDASFFVFSNDATWCKENILPIIGPGFDTEFVSWNIGEDSYNDMRLMSCCDVNILANSSFSWWAAFLNHNDNPIVIAPKIWARGSSCTRQLPDWLLIENEL